ncbi:hypothetical protein [Desulfovibrio fairfieldensis]|uniref:Uncharacterized protein n=1 Tax=Desulfovibrio fairfieldensis TaxID=44742 RepID=A0A0X8JI66_9BACT|nr:hypothetical protein [Desulfovibrio fairfieldensis]AMD88843.1 hypothetical protein AXF13_01200 [Desulfovibrio fairfieldensis]
MDTMKNRVILALLDEIKALLLDESQEVQTVEDVSALSRLEEQLRGQDANVENEDIIIVKFGGANSPQLNRYKMALADWEAHIKTARG